MSVISLKEAMKADPMGMPLILATYQCECVDGSGTHEVSVYKGRRTQDEVGTDEIKACCHLEDFQPCGRHSEFVFKYTKEAVAQEESE